MKSSGIWRVVVLCQIILLFVMSPFMASGESPTEQAQSNLRDLHRSKAGIYVRLGNSSSGTQSTPPSSRDRRRGGRGQVRLRSIEDTRSLLLSHPLVDGVIVSVSWSQLEPRQGQFSLDGLIGEINEWGEAGKGVVLRVSLYGQSAEDPHTPDWVFDQPDVRTITFIGGGRARGQEIRVPAVWDEGFVEEYIEPLAQALSQAIDGHQYLNYIQPGFGHIGNLTAQPSRDGARAFHAAGFDGVKWKLYCRAVCDSYREHFMHTPLLFVSAGMILRDPATNHYRALSQELVGTFSTEGTAIVHFGLEDTPEKMTQVFKDLGESIPLAHAGITRIGLGDDWPLWVPESRRSQGPTRGHDEEFLGKALEAAFGGSETDGEIPLTILWCQMPEILASHIDSREYRPEVARALKRARDRIQAIDSAIFDTAD